MATMGVLAGGIVVGTGAFTDTAGHATASGDRNSNTSGGTDSGATAGNNSGGDSGQNSASAGQVSDGSAKDGTYDGDVVQTRYGPMQVEIVISRGKIESATALQHPGSDSTSQQINSQVIPILTKATVDYQTVQFGNVSRATISTMAYKQSAQSALDQAGFTG